MTTSVDVLAVIDCAAETLVRMKGSGASPKVVHIQRDGLVLARYAVAELIEADLEFDKVRVGYNPLYARRDQLERYESADRRRAAALSRVKGA